MVHNLLTEQLDTVVVLLVELIGSVVISLSRCCLPNDEGPAPPPNIFSSNRHWGKQTESHTDGQSNDTGGRCEGGGLITYLKRRISSARYSAIEKSDFCG